MIDYVDADRSVDFWRPGARSAFAELGYALAKGGRILATIAAKNAKSAQENRKVPDLASEASRFGYVVEAARFDVRPNQELAGLLKSAGERLGRQPRSRRRRSECDEACLECSLMDSNHEPTD